MLWLCAAAAAALALMRPLQDPDLWWHVAVGDWILANRAVPTVDLWTTVGLHHPWRAYSWAAEAVAAAVDRRFGLPGLLILKLGLLLFLVSSLFYCFSRLAGDWPAGALLGIAAAWAMIARRPQAVRKGAVLACAGLVVLSFWVAKFMPFGFVAPAALAAVIWRAARPALEENLRLVKTVRQILCSWPCLAVVLLVLSGGIRRGLALGRQPLNPGMVPAEAVDFIERHHLPRPVLSNYSWGAI